MKFSKQIIIGIVFIAAIALFIWGFNFLEGRDVFSKQRTYVAVYNDISGLIKSNPVSVKGLKVGQVSDIYFDPGETNNIIVELSIFNDIGIPENSIAKIYSSDLMGSKAIEIMLGDSKELAGEGDTLNSRVEASLKEEVNRQVQPIKNKAEDLLSSIDSVVTVIQYVFNPETRQNIQKSFESIKTSFKNLESTSYNLDTLIKSQKIRLASILENVESISANLRANNKEFNTIIDNFASFSDSIAAAEVPKTLKRVDESFASLNKILTRIEKGEGTMGLLVNDDSLYYELEKSADDLNKLLEDIRNNPKKYVKFSVF